MDTNKEDIKKKPILNTRIHEQQHAMYITDKWMIINVHMMWCDQPISCQCELVTAVGRAGVEDTADNQQKPFCASSITNTLTTGV